MCVTTAEPPLHARHHRPTAWSLSLGRLGTHPSARCPGRAPASPGQARSAVRRMMPSSPRAGATPTSNSGANRALGDTRASPHPFPTASTGELAGTLVEPPPAAPGDQIASPQLFPGPHQRNKGIHVNLKTFQGPR
jgi:hypothetical protein